MFRPDDELEALWNEHGYPDSMFWRRDMLRPITLDALEAIESAWLNSGETDEYGSYSYFVYRFYSDDEKQNLWNEQARKRDFCWRLGMRRPEVIGGCNRGRSASVKRIASAGLTFVRIFGSTFVFNMEKLQWRWGR
ncbi:hypothetical protein [Bradyrhizobium cenepequi]|uniref:hypothetical protein n=1 Tax=Bradyrhizobium cenepequi TaxID=2821403 RepID=UPI001CE2BB2F|nr:hypothetical protein [Bradyrhizobium cenepequi]MCA6112188.1 hypothetical protein [Bradyrhizobium cenepequi]